MMDADTISNSSLDNRDDGSSHDSHNEQAGAFPGERAESGYAQG